MCGIAGIFAYADSAPQVDRGELLRIRERMANRGPDGNGLWLNDDGRVGLAHRRLAIIDLSATGAQPMSTVDGRLHVVFNGEIYNYRELRRQIEAEGTVFRSASDTEVLLHLYRRHGPDMLRMLRGMFALAIWDQAEHRLFLARDPFGIKPLYFADDGKTLRFASQVKALLAGGSVDTSADAAGHVGFYLWGHVPEPHTLYRGINALAAGSGFWMDKSGRKTTRRYFELRNELIDASERSAEISIQEMQDVVTAAVQDSVRHHMIADVPVGVFLSAGIDSSTITAIAAELQSSQLRTVTLGFREYANTPDDEVPLAELTSRRYGTTHSACRIEASEFFSELDRVFDAMDQPSIDGVNSYFVSKVTAGAGLKVALSGLGGDELFGGYPGFSQIPLIVSSARAFGPLPFFGRAFRAVTQPVLKVLTSPKYAGWFEYGGTYGGAYLLRRGLYMPWELPELLGPEMAREGLNELQPVLEINTSLSGIKGARAKIAAMELSMYMRNQLLRDTDWASMAHSIEVRVPMVDVVFFRAIAPLLFMNVPPSKRNLIAAPAVAFPQGVAARRKTGFSTPIRQWLTEANLVDKRDRHFRGWARRVVTRQDACTKVHREPRRGKRFIAITTDAFGGHGGIALYNRDYLTAMCNYPACGEVVAFPRLVSDSLEPLPAGMVYVTDGIGGKLAFMTTVLTSLLDRRPVGLIACGHINLLPIALIARLFLHAPVVLFVYGIDAWSPTRSALCNMLARRADAVISISRVTLDRFLGWSRTDPARCHILPNAIHAENYHPRPKDRALVDRFRLKDKVVLMTVGRLSSIERYKGFDEVLDAIPELTREIPNIAYLIGGTGADRDRLERKAKALGITDRVLFAGFIPEDEKADYYQLAHVYVMPSSGEGFGFVFLEAIASGIPAVGSNIDGGREALRDGILGILVDPKDPKAIIAGIRKALAQPRGTVPKELEYFSYPNFESRLHGILSHVLGEFDA